MAFPLLPAIAAGLQTATSIFTNKQNNDAIDKRNADDRAFQTDMYNRQRQDSLSDWAMQNAYNSPKNQMKLYKEAGLNPNLIYGSGTVAQADNPRASSPGSYNPVAQSYNYAGIENAMSMMYDLRMKDAQMDNLQTARAVQQQDILLKAAQTQSTLSDVHTKDFDLKMKNDLKTINVDMAQQALDKARADVDRSWNEANISENNSILSDRTLEENVDKAKAEARKALNEANASNHLEERVLQEIDNLKKDGNLKQFQVNLNKLGITPSDNVFLRILTTLFGNKLPKF